MSVLALTLALLLSSQSPADSCRQAAAAYGRGDLEQAARHLELCIDEHPSELVWLVRLCAVYQSLGRDGDLFRAALRGVDRFPGEQRFYLTAGAHAAKNGDFPQAEAIFSNALSRWPDDPALKTNFAEVLLLRGVNRLDTGENEAAEADLRRAVELDGSNCNALMNLGRAQYNLRRTSEALETFDRVLKVCPDAPATGLHRGIVLATVGRDEEAVKALDSFLAAHPDPDGYYFRGLSYKRLGDCESALRDFEAATTGQPSNADGHYERAGCLERLGRIREAEAAFRRATELEPDRPRFRLALGRMLMKTGRREEGLALVKEAESGYAGMVREDQRRLMFKSLREEQSPDANP